MSELKQKSYALFSWFNWWDKVFTKDLSLKARMLIAFIIALTAELLHVVVFHYTSSYFHSLTIFTVLLISLFTGLTPGIIFSILLSLVNDYSFLPPVGSVLENTTSIEHFAINTTLSIFVSLIVFTLRDTYKKLIKAKQEAELTNRLKTNFLATMSHEIRTPLNGIIGLSDVLRKLNLSEEEKGYSELIHSSGKTLLKIINDILDYSKAESEKIQLEPSNFSIADIIEQISLTLKPKATQKSIHLSYVLDEHIPSTVFGDSSRLSQVLFNLVGNAIKFTTYGSIIIKARRDFNTNAESAKIVFSVTDTGIGLTPAQQEKLFQPFVQLQKVGTSGEAGTGLGLSICRKILRAMNSEIFVESKINEGSRFYFALDFTKFSDDKIGKNNLKLKDQNPNSETQFKKLFDQLEHPTILVADDNPTNQITAQIMLEKIGAHTILAANGLEVIDLATKTNIDLILMDCQMPVMDGYEATRKLRENKFRAPIIAMTANSSEDDLIACLAAGMNSILLKPLTFDQLYTELTKILTPAPNYIADDVLKKLGHVLGFTGRSKVILAFLSGINEMLELLSDKDLNNDIEKIHRLGHKYRTSTETVGALGLSYLFKQLEKTADLNQAQTIIQLILRNYLEVEAQLKLYIVQPNLEK